MKATLEFNLPEEEEEHRHALAGSGLGGVLLDLDNELRNHKKHHGKEHIPIDTVRQILRELLESRDLLWILG